jgi:hypothetical protein
MLLYYYSTNSDKKVEQTYNLLINDLVIYTQLLQTSKIQREAHKLNT